VFGRKRAKSIGGRAGNRLRLVEAGTILGLAKVWAVVKLWKHEKAAAGISRDATGGSDGVVTRYRLASVCGLEQSCREHDDPPVVVNETVAQYRCDTSLQTSNRTIATLRRPEVDIKQDRLSNQCRQL
jgi:hypothetical protein